MRIGEVLDNKYRLERLLGEGSLGVVFEAFEQPSGRHVVIKYTPPHVAARAESVDRYFEEARTPGELGSPHIAPLIDAGKTAADAPYLVRDYLEGRDLSDYAADHGGKLSPSRAISLIRQACQGLSVAHQRGIRHFDLKPQNLFVCQGPGGEETLKILDFGVAGMRETLAEGASDATVTGQVIGMPHYMPMEQARGLPTRDQRVDIYALGSILYELLAGTRPFVADNYPQLLLLIATTEAPPVHEKRPELGEELSTVVHKAMAKEPEDRYATTDELSEALAPFEAFVLEEAPPPRPISAPVVETGPEIAAAPATPRRAGTPRRWLWVAVIAGVTLVIGVAAIIIALTVLREPAARLSAQDADFTDERGGSGWAERCYFHYTARRHSNARAACLRGLEVADDDQVRATLYYNLGRVWAGEGSRRRARRYFQKALRARPNYTAAQERLDEL